MFKKKKEKPETEPYVFVPKFYVFVEYGDDRSVRSKYFDSEEAAHVERQNIMHEAEAQDWVDVGTTMVRSQAIKSLSVYQTTPRLPLGGLTRW